MTTERDPDCRPDGLCSRDDCYQAGGCIIDIQERDRRRFAAPAVRTWAHAALVALLLLAGSSQVSAADAPLTVQQAIDAYSGLSALDSYEDVDKDGKTIKRFYRFPGPVRMAIARHIETLGSVFRAFQLAQTDLVHQYADATGEKVALDKMTLYLKDLDKMTSASAGVSLSKIREQDLDLVNNPIPPSILSRILPLVEQQ